MRGLFGVLAAALLSQTPGLPAGHPAVSAGKVPPSARELLQQLDAQPDLKTRDKTFEVAAALAKLYYANARYRDAVEYFGQAMEKGKPLRALYLDQAAKAGIKVLAKSFRDVPSAELPSRVKDAQRALTQRLKNAPALGCALTSDAEIEKLVTLAKEKANAGQNAEAFTCAHEAVKPLAEAQSLYGNALELTGDAKGALSAYAEVLMLAPTDEESLYGYAGTLWDAHPEQASSLAASAGLLKLELAVNPQGHHAAPSKRLLDHLERVASEGGFGAYQKKHGASMAEANLDLTPSSEPPPMAPMAGGMANASPGPLSPAVVDAVKNTEMTPELVKGLDALVETAEDALAHQRFQDALDAYKRVVPFRPKDGRARAGMAWALVGLNKQPMADRIWGVAVESDAAAVDALGDRLAAHGDRPGAVALWKKLSASAPGYASSAGLAKKLP